MFVLTLCDKNLNESFWLNAKWINYKKACSVLPLILNTPRLLETWECWNWKLKETFKFQRIFFIWESWKFLRFPSFRFCHLYWNRNLENLEIFSRLLNLNEFFLIEKNWEIPRFPSFWFWPLQWNRKIRKLGNSQNPQIKQILWNLCLEKIFKFSKVLILV